VQTKTLSQLFGENNLATIGALDRIRLFGEGDRNNTGEWLGGGILASAIIAGVQQAVIQEISLQVITVASVATTTPTAAGLLYRVTGDSDQLYVSTGTNTGDLVTCGLGPTEISALVAAQVAGITIASLGGRTAAQITTEISGAISTHNAATDPHPTYTTSAELGAALTGLLNTVAHDLLTGDRHRVTQHISGTGAGQTVATVVPQFINQRIINTGVTPNLEYRATGTTAGAVVAIGATGGGSSGHVIRDESTALAARTNLDIVGSTVVASDVSASDATRISINPLIRQTTAQLLALATGAVDAIYLNTDTGRFGFWDPAIDNNLGGFVFS
jgi:hypothetical protein